MKKLHKPIILKDTLTQYACFCSDCTCATDRCSCNSCECPMYPSESIASDYTKVQSYQSDYTDTYRSLYLWDAQYSPSSYAESSFIR